MSSPDGRSGAEGTDLDSPRRGGTCADGNAAAWWECKVDAAVAARGRANVDKRPGRESGILKDPVMAAEEGESFKTSPAMARGRRDDDAA